MIDVVCTVIDLADNSRHVGYIRFDVDGGKPFDYRARGSYNAFAHGQKEYAYRKHGRKKVVLHYCNRYSEWRSNRERTISFFNEQRGIIRDLYKVPFKRVNSLWEFYEFIGYDYKSKKYITEYEPAFKKQNTFRIKEEQ